MTKEDILHLHNIGALVGVCFRYKNSQASIQYDIKVLSIGNIYLEIFCLGNINSVKQYTFCLGLHYLVDNYEFIKESSHEEVER